MEAERCIYQPGTMLRFLAQQVQEQSELCDITVKRGQWERKFHRCVLAASSFFKRALMGKFLEKKTGVVEIRIDATAKEIEMALMFLYGKTPTLNVDNVGGLLQLAEFFMIKGLKYECIIWLRAMNINIDTCVGVLLLSKQYNFEVKTCIDYIESHLSAVLQHDTATRLTEDLIERFFSDVRLSYVSMDQKFRFLLQWICKHPSVTRENIAVMFELINMHEVTQSTWETARLNPIFCEILNSNNVVRLAGDRKFYRAALIRPSKTGSFCLDIQQNEWYRLKSNIYDCNRNNLFKEMSETSRNRPELYFTGNTSNPLSFKITTLNLETDQMKVYQVALKGENTTNTGSTKIHVMEDRVIASMCKSFSVTRSVSSSITPSRGRQYSLNRYWEEISSTAAFETCKNINTSVLYIGHLSDGLIELTPIFSLLNENIAKVCLNRLSSIALLPHYQNYVLLFDLLDYKLEKLELASEKEIYDEIVQTDDGFLIYNDEGCFCLTRLSGPSLTKKYLVEKHEFETDASEEENDASEEDIYVGKKSKYTYHFSNGFWKRSRIVRPMSFCRGHTELHYVPQEALLTCHLFRELNWKHVSLPNERLDDFTLYKNLFVVPLPTHNFGCHIKCPHCKLPKQSRSDWSDLETYTESLSSQSSDDISDY